MGGNSRENVCATQPEHAGQVRPPNRVQSNARMDTTVKVMVELKRVRENALAIRRRVGVDVLAVVKADAYGLGAAEVARAIGDVVAGFCVFSLAEAQVADLWNAAKKPILAFGPSEGMDAADFVAAHVRPAVWTVEQAARLCDASPVLCVDTGMQRFACPADQIEFVLRAGECREAFTHAIRLEHVYALTERVGNRGLKLHAAASGLLDEPAARLDAVRPGIALYRGAVRVTARLLEVRDGGQPAGYGGFIVPRFGIIRCGYTNGLRPGPCLVNGARQTILEVGMQSSYVQIGATDKAGDEVILLGDGLTEAEVAQAWKTTEHQVLVSLTRAGRRTY
jgi:alanine racemase